MWHRKRSGKSKRKDIANNRAARKKFTNITDFHSDLELMFNPLKNNTDLLDSTCLNSTQDNSGLENDTITKQIEQMKSESTEISKIAEAAGISPEMVLLLQIKEMLNNIRNDSQ